MVTMRHFLPQIKILTLALLAHQSSLLWAQEFNFLPSFEPEASAPPIGGDGIFSLGVYSETSVPIGSTFKTFTQTDNQSMNFQMPIGFGLEASYGLSNRIELAITGGYERYETKQFTGFDASTIKQYDRIGYRLFPAMAIVRMRWGRNNWAPELQVGAGAAFGTIEARSTIVGSETTSTTGPFFRGFASAGYAFQWAEGYSIHFHVGYTASQFGNQTYQTSFYTISQQSLHHGVYFRGWARYHF